MLNEFLLVGGWIFWTILGAVIFIEALLLANESDVEALVLAAIALVAAAAFTDAFKSVSWQEVAAAGTVYVCAGVLWSFKKWWGYVVWKRRDLEASYRSYTKKAEQTVQGVADYLQKNRPTAADNKGRIVAWMALWPLSFAWWATTLPRKFFSWVYDCISTIFDRITDRVFARAAIND